MQDDTHATTAETDAPKASQPNTPPATPYDSNPFTAAWGGLRKLIHTNAHAVIGVALFNILLFTLLAITGVILVLSIAAFAFKHSPDLQQVILDPNLVDFLRSLSDTSIYATWILGVAACIFISALTQSIQMNLTIASAKRTSITFGALLKASITSVLPILGYISLIILTLFALFILLGMLSVILGIITLVVGLVALLIVAYAGIRLSYTPYIIVDLRLGPVEAAKRSWTLSKGHVIETIGSGAVAWLALAVPSIVIQALARVTEGAPMLSGLFGIIDMVLIVALIIAAGMSVAERYVQLQNLSAGKITATSLSPFNYLAILLVVFLAPVLNALTPQLETGTNQNLPSWYEAPRSGTDGSSDTIYQFN